MPLYEYRCGKCGNVFEAYRRLSEETGEETCPSCGGSASRLGISRVTAGGSSPAKGSACGPGGKRSPFR